MKSEDASEGPCYVQPPPAPKSKQELVHEFIDEHLGPVPTAIFALLLLVALFEISTYV